VPEKDIQRTEIYLTGEQALALLERNGVNAGDPEINENGEILLVSFTGEEQFAVSPLGSISIAYGSVNQGDDFYGNRILSHEVTLDVTDAKALQGQRSQKKNRRIHINKLEKRGKQKVRKSVEMVVRTNVPRTIFESRVR
jgi:hypothetical protein